MIGFSWTQFGAFVSAAANLSDDKLDRFAGIGGRWLVPVVYNDNATGPWNLANIEWIKQRCSIRGIHCGAWINCFGEEPEQIAAATADIVLKHGLSPVVLDAEGNYQLNTKMSPLVAAVRAKLPVGTKPLAVSTNSLNDSVVYNGRIGGALEAGAKSFRDLNIHVLPQWYNAPVYGQGEWTRADQNMKWLAEHGFQDNFFAPNYGDHRAVTAGMVHGTLEVTGLENATLAVELAQCKAAQPFGYGKGISLYLLENMPDSDFAEVARYRGVLYAA